MRRSEEHTSELQSRQYHSEMWSPMAIAVIGGLTVSTVLTLVLIPTLYLSLIHIYDKERTLVDIYSVSHTFVAVHKWMTQSFGSQMKGLRADFGEVFLTPIRAFPNHRKDIR